VVSGAVHTVDNDFLTVQYTPIDQMDVPWKQQVQLKKKLHRMDRNLRSRNDHSKQCLNRKALTMTTLTEGDRELTDRMAWKLKSRLEVWSRTHNKWCPGIVYEFDKANDVLYVEYNPRGEIGEQGREGIDTKKGQTQMGSAYCVRRIKWQNSKESENNKTRMDRNLRPVSKIETHEYYDPPQEEGLLDRPKNASPPASTMSSKRSSTSRYSRSPRNTAQTMERTTSSSAASSTLAASSPLVMFVEANMGALQAIRGWKKIKNNDGFPNAKQLRIYAKDKGINIKGIATRKLLREMDEEKFESCLPYIHESMDAKASAPRKKTSSTCKGSRKGTQDRKASKTWCGECQEWNATCKHKRRRRRLTSAEAVLGPLLREIMEANGA